MKQRWFRIALAAAALAAPGHALAASIKAYSGNRVDVGKVRQLLRNWLKQAFPDITFEGELPTITAPSEAPKLDSPGKRGLRPFVLRFERPKKTPPPSMKEAFVFRVRRPLVFYRR